MLENCLLGTDPQHPGHVGIEGRTQTIRDSKLASLQSAGDASLNHHLEIGSGLPIHHCHHNSSSTRHSVLPHEHFTCLP